MKASIEFDLSEHSFHIIFGWQLPIPPPRYAGVECSDRAAGIYRPYGQGYLPLEPERISRHLEPNLPYWKLAEWANQPVRVDGDYLSEHPSVQQWRPTLTWQNDIRNDVEFFGANSSVCLATRNHTVLSGQAGT